MSNSLITDKPMKITPEEWEKLKPQLASFAGTTAAIAEAVFVLGMSKSEAARHVGTTPQNVSGAIKRVTAHLNGYPPDWVPVTEWMSSKTAAVVRKMVKEEREKLLGKKDED